MKTSNYIFSAFLIFLFGGILLLFIGAKFYKGADNEDSFLTQEKPLNTFSVVVAEPGANFVLKNGAQNKISQRYLKELAPDFAPFKVRNDTLFVYSVKEEDSNKQGQSTGGYFIIVPEIFCKKVKCIIAKEKSKINLEGFEADSLSINLNTAEFVWRYDKAGFVSINAKNSNIYFEGKDLEKLTIQLDKTKLRVVTKERIDKLSGSLKNDSEGDFSYGNSVRLDADKTSRYGFYN
jgi:hypothetical protein